MNDDSWLECIRLAVYLVIAIGIARFIWLGIEYFAYFVLGAH